MRPMQQRAQRIILFSILGLLGMLTVLSLEKIQQQERVWKTALLERNPQWLHCEQMQVAAAEATMDASNIHGAPSNAQFEAEYRHHRMQLQANWLGMEQMAAQDPEREGLLQEIRTSVANLFLAMDTVKAYPVKAANKAENGAAGTGSDAAQIQETQLRDALQRTQTALGNYAGSLEQESGRLTTDAHVSEFRMAWLSLALVFLFCVALLTMRG